MALTLPPIASGGRRRWLLALSGGGYRGLFTAQFLARLEKEIGRPLGEVFDLVAGTSIGSILALGIAHRIPAATLVGFFVDHGDAIFPGALWRRALQLIRPKYSTNALRLVLGEVFGNSQVSKLQTCVLVPAVRLSDSSAAIFRTKNGAQPASPVSVVDAALASAAAPTYFRPHAIGSAQFADGGLIANSPDALAVIEATSVLGWPQDEVFLLSVGTTGAATGMPYSARGRDWGIVGWARGLTLLQQMMAAQAQLSRQSANLMLGTRAVIVDSVLSAEQGDVVGLDRASARATNTLAAMADAAWVAFQRDESATLASLTRHAAQ